MGKGDPQGGRPRVYSDERARKRTYYAKNKEREREKSLSRWHDRQRRKQVARILANEARRGTQRLLPNAMKVKGFRVSISSVAELDVLCSALKADLCLWRGIDSNDEDRFDNITLRALRLREEGRPEDELKRITEPLTRRLKAVYEAADKASDEAWRRDTSAAVLGGSTWQQLCNLVREAQRVESALEEIGIFYRCTADQFRGLYEEGRLMWQLMV